MTVRIFVFIGTLVLGLGIIRYNLLWVSWVGKSQWAENKLGSGGTYTLWKLIAIGIIIFGFLVLIGEFVLTPGEEDKTDNSQPIQNEWVYEQ